MAKTFALVVGALAALILSVAALAAATQPARAQNLGPAFSGGDFPLLSWYSNANCSQDTTLYTVPAGKKLVVRNFCVNTTSWRLAVNGTQRVDTTLTSYPGNDDAWPSFCTGSAQLVLEPGDVLSVDSNTTSTSSACRYAVEATLMTE
jgi:hypothetical protein